MKRIFLIGFMGAGKTTAGKNLAKKLDCTFAIWIIILNLVIKKQSVRFSKNLEKKNLERSRENA